MSNRPNARSVVETMASTSEGLRTSPVTVSARTPSRWMSVAVCPRCSAFRLARTTSHPNDASDSAMPRQMPVPPPVTRAALPASRPDANPADIASIILLWRVGPRRPCPPRRPRPRMLRQPFDVLGFDQLGERQRVDEIRRLEQTRHAIDRVENLDLLSGVRALQLFELSRFDQDVAFERAN